MLAWEIMDDGGVGLEDLLCEFGVEDRCETEGTATAEDEMGIEEVTGDICTEAREEEAADFEERVGNVDSSTETLTKDDDPIAEVNCLLAETGVEAASEEKEIEDERIIDVATDKGGVDEAEEETSADLEDKIVGVDSCTEKLKEVEEAGTEVDCLCDEGDNEICARDETESAENGGLDLGTDGADEAACVDREEIPDKRTEKLGNDEDAGVEPNNLL